MLDESDGSAPYVFLSYASVEQERALAVSTALQQQGIAVWLDRHAITGGSAWSTAIVRGIKNCAVFLVLGSDRAFGSPNVQRELNLAVEENRPLLPLLLEPAAAPDDVRYALAGRQWVALLDRPPDLWLPEVLRALAALGVASNTAVAGTGELARQSDTSNTVLLPVSPTSFLGREQELVEIARLLANHRLLTLTGPGGTGKTRLALAVAAQAAARFPDGVCFVDLSGVVDPAGVIPAIAAVLAVRESDGRSLAVSLAAYLRRKRLLLVLDNFEQVVGAALTLFDLLAEAPGLTLLVTSRVLLHVEGEREYAVAPLPLPDERATAPESLRTSPAVQLFLERAQALRPGFILGTENAAAVSAICRRLDGLPLAIELAAARVKLLPPTQLLARLEQRLAFLTGGERNRPMRQQTLRNTIQWSWDLLAESEQTLFRRLGVFAGGFTLEAAEAVCNTPGEVNVLEGLSALVDQSLVRQTETEGAPRFSLLALLQEFALEQLQKAEETTALRHAHAAYYAALAEAADLAWWSTGRMREDLLQQLDPERDNLLGALGWAVVERDAESGLHLGSALGAWFYVRAPGEGLQWFARLLDVIDAAVLPAFRGRVLAGAAACALARGDVPLAAAYHEAAADCFRVAEDLPMLGRALALLANSLPEADAERSRALCEDALRLAQSVDGPFALAVVKSQIGMALLGHGGDAATARKHLEEALSVARAVGADWLTMFALELLAPLSEAEERNDTASALWHEALPLAEALGDRAHIASTRLGLAQLAFAAGEADAAAEQWRRALLLVQELDSALALAPCLAGIAGLLNAQRRYEPAARLLAASATRRNVVEQNPLFAPQFRAAFAPALAATRAGLSAEAFAEAWAGGEQLTLDQATDLALSELASRQSLERVQDAR